MAEEFQIMDRFELDLQWPANPGAGGNPLLDGTLARFEMKAGECALTSYQTDNGDKSSCLHVPLYYLVEWLALNWWAFLYEPRKLDREDAEQEFRSRHWLGTPRNGFALPDVMFSPVGEKIEIVARPAYLRFAKLNFTEALLASVSTTLIRDRFFNFIDRVIGHLKDNGISRSPAHEAWERVKNTVPEQEAYCKLIGSMGLSPYVPHPEIDATMESISANISDAMMSDLCEATNIGNFNRSANLAETISKMLASSTAIEVDGLLKVRKPVDATPRAYEWGYKATDIVRDAFGISYDDPSGAQAFFDRLRIDVSSNQENATDANQYALISGALERHESDMKLSLGGSSLAQRKFAAARASFLAWSEAKDASRLVTTARTRDQQASRAFAAELLAPAKYLRKRLGYRGEVSPFTLDRLSEEMGVASTVVHYQARNHGYVVAEAA